jgi:hypothetical protein
MFCMVAFEGGLNAEEARVGEDLTDEGQIEDVEEPLWNLLAKDWPAVVFFVTAPGINLHEQGIRWPHYVRIEEASAVCVVVQTDRPDELRPHEQYLRLLR